MDRKAEIVQLFSRLGELLCEYLSELSVPLNQIDNGDLLTVKQAAKLLSSFRFNDTTASTVGTDSYREHRHQHSSSSQ